MTQGGVNAPLNSVKVTLMAFAVIFNYNTHSITSPTYLTLFRTQSSLHVICLKLQQLEKIIILHSAWIGKNQPFQCVSTPVAGHKNIYR